MAKKTNENKLIEQRYKIDYESFPVLKDLKVIKLKETEDLFVEVTDIRSKESGQFEVIKKNMLEHSYYQLHCQDEYKQYQKVKTIYTDIYEKKQYQMLLFIQDRFKDKERWTMLKELRESNCISIEKSLYIYKKYSDENSYFYIDTFASHNKKFVSLVRKLIIDTKLFDNKRCDLLDLYLVMAYVLFDDALVGTENILLRNVGGHLLTILQIENGTSDPESVRRFNELNKKTRDELKKFYNDNKNTIGLVIQDLYDEAEISMDIIVGIVPKLSIIHIYGDDGNLLNRYIEYNQYFTRDFFWDFIRIVNCGQRKIRAFEYEDIHICEGKDIQHYEIVGSKTIAESKFFCLPAHEMPYKARDIFSKKLLKQVLVMRGKRVNPKYEPMTEENIGLYLQEVGLKYSSIINEIPEDSKYEMRDLKEEDLVNKEINVIDDIVIQVGDKRKLIHRIEDNVEKKQANSVGGKLIRFNIVLTPTCKKDIIKQGYLDFSGYCNEAMRTYKAISRVKTRRQKPR